MDRDIFYLHNTINNMIFIDKTADFILPAFITCDQRLKDIERIYTLNGFAYNKKTLQTHKKYNVDLIDPRL